MYLRILAGVGISLLGCAVGVLGLGIWLNPEFYERTLRYGSPRGTPVRPFAFVAAIVALAMVALGVSMALGLID